MQNKKVSKMKAGALIIGLILFSSCANVGTTSNDPRNANTSPTANSNRGAAPEAAMLETREPETYSVRTTVTVQPTGNAPQAHIPPLQFNFAKLGAERRVSFKLPDPVGDVVYLEKGALKYLIVPARNQFVELDPQELGFQLGELLSPASAIQKLKARAKHEMLGTETVNGRVAVKYGFKGSADTRTTAGTAEGQSVVYVDQETGLPLRSETETTTSSGAGARIVTWTDDLQFSVDPSQFEVPTAMKKVTSADLKQQVQGFVGAVRAVANYLRQQADAPAAGERP